MSNSWKRGSTRRQREVRAAILAANLETNGGRCTIQLPDVCTGMAEQSHHILGYAATGDDPRYQVAACGACNLKVGDPTRARDPAPRPATQW